MNGTKAHPPVHLAGCLGRLAAWWLMIDWVAASCRWMKMKITILITVLLYCAVVDRHTACFSLATVEPNIPHSSSTVYCISTSSRPPSTGNVLQVRHGGSGRLSKTTQIVIVIP